MKIQPKKKEDFPKYFIMDFEGVLQKAIKKSFDNVKIDGYYFYFVKLLWTKANELNLFAKDRIKNTKILLFILEIIFFMRIDEKINFYENI